MGSDREPRREPIAADHHRNGLRRTGRLRVRTCVVAAGRFPGFAGHRIGRPAFPVAQWRSGRPARRSQLRRQPRVWPSEGPHRIPFSSGALPGHRRVGLTTAGKALSRGVTLYICASLRVGRRTKKRRRPRKPRSAAAKVAGPPLETVRDDRDLNRGGCSPAEWRDPISVTQHESGCDRRSTPPSLGDAAAPLGRGGGVGGSDPPHGRTNTRNAPRNRGQDDRPYLGVGAWLAKHSSVTPKAASQTVSRTAHTPRSAVS